jgi:diguanylate cyclase (GGDEF)-like protein
MNLSEYLKKQPKPYLIMVSFMIIILIGIADYLTGEEVSSAIFYLLPVSLSAWFIGKGAALLISFISAITWITADLIARKSYLHPLIHFWNTIMSLGIFLLVSYILSALKTSLEQEKILSRTDTLTGLMNRRYFNELAVMEISRAHRFKHPFSVAYVDIDDFKTVNDRFGHSAGDTLLCSVAGIMQQNIRETDIAARLGGDEFVILMPETGDESARVVFPKLQVQLLETVQKKKWAVTFSIGVMTFMTPPASVDDMISSVDNLMYAVKKSGKNEIIFDVFEDIKMTERQ